MSEKRPPSTGKNAKISLVKLATTNSASKAFVPPVLHEVGKLAAGVAAVSAGSATGNPRNKCALQPGHSLLDWIRLGSSKDLTGVGEQAGRLTITPNQLAQHDKNTDAWLAIRGKVYNVTAYLPFHPGGPDELMKGVGRDATTLFDQIHPWVNYDSILQKCFIGKLVPIDPNIDSEAIFMGKEKASPPTKVQSATPKPLPSTPPAKKQSPLHNEPKENTYNSDASPQTQTPTENSSDASKASLILLPRFDWIQKLDYITIIFYTKSFSNPQISITPPNSENVLNVFLTYDNMVFVNELKFYKSINWPCQIKVFSETGKIEVQFKKSETKIWENYGVLKQKSHEVSQDDMTTTYKMISKVQVNHNTFLMEFQRVDDCRIVIPIGKHVRIFGTVNGEEFSRSYTPVPDCLMKKFKVQSYTTSNICLLIKRYPDGNISRYICDKNINDTVKMSCALGTFDLRDLDNRETFVMLAAGTGITPMLALILFLLDRRVRKCRRISLLFFNKTEEDILFRDQLEGLQNDDSRFKFDSVLSQPSSDWKGLKGHITKRMIEDTIKRDIDNTGYTKNDIHVSVCGPTLFTNLTQSLMTELGLKDEQIYLFLG